MSKRRSCLSCVVVITLLLITGAQSATPEDDKLTKPQDVGKQASSQKTNGSAANEKGSTSKATFECVEEDTECTKDKLGYEAITYLHRLIDDDHNGNVDQSESDEFLRDELQYTDGFERHSLFHNNDKLISVDDLWKAWKFSRVYNWTVDDVLDWLQDEVELPQYIPIFKDNAVGGSFLPRLASSNTFMATILGIKNPVHKQKLTLKAMDTVLFGPPPKRHNYIKDLALMISLVFAVGGCWFGIAHHRYSQTQVRKMTKNLEALQKAEDALTEIQKKLEDAEGKQVSAVPRSSSDDGHMGYSAEEGTEQIREELAATLLALQQAETQLGHSWAPSAELQAWLQLTHELELVHYNNKRQAAERQFQSAKESCEKIKRRNRAIFGSLRMAHSNSLDEIDQRILDAKLALEEVKQDLQERLQRWHTIERLCGFPVITNPGLATLHQILYGTKEGGSSRLTAGSGSVDETEEEPRPSGYATLPTSHSKPFLRQRVLMGSTGSLSQMPRSGVGSMYPAPQPHHLLPRGSHDVDSPSLAYGTLSSPESLTQSDLGQEHPSAMSYGMPHSLSSTSNTDRARSFSLTPSLASSTYSAAALPQISSAYSAATLPQTSSAYSAATLPQTSSAYSAATLPQTSSYHVQSGMMSAEAVQVAAASAGSGTAGQNCSMSLDNSEDNLSQATLDSLSPSQLASGSINNGLDHVSHSQLMGPDGAVLTPRLQKKSSMRKKMMNIFKKTPKKTS